MAPGPPRWHAMTMGVDTEGEAPATAVEAMAAATAAAATVAAATEEGEAMEETAATEEGPGAASEGAQAGTTGVLGEEATEGVGVSSEAAAGAPTVGATLGRAGAAVVIRVGRASACA